MIFPHPLIHATLRKRYKRFLADVQLDSGETITVHCPNSGSMRGCSTPGSPVCLSLSDNKKRKYPHTLEMVMENNTWIGVNTSLTNRIVAEALEEGKISELSGFDSLKREVKTSSSSRLDLMLERGGKRTYIEIKNCSLVENALAMFPDAVAARGTKHLHELAALREKKNRAVIFFLVQRMDAISFTPASAIDPLYAQTLRDVSKRGVEILVYQAQVTPTAIEVTGRLPCTLAGESGYCGNVTLRKPSKPCASPRTSAEYRRGDR